eukprot:TRINITY_DN16240_c1_g1_i14.p1 TRINITY_DN16240_c1_g1~~TRINITY_DN16240_c1_g1_i14.p1  ORF type:complete len:473 (-),score=18.26 TRINITY_DN16240_c1_g1_i14:364-1782(-)
MQGQGKVFYKHTRQVFRVKNRRSLLKAVPSIYIGQQEQKLQFEKFRSQVSCNGEGTLSGDKYTTTNQLESAPSLSPVATMQSGNGVCQELDSVDSMHDVSSQLNIDKNGCQTTLQNKDQPSISKYDKKWSQLKQQGEKCVVTENCYVIGREHLLHQGFWRFAYWFHNTWLMQVSEGLEHLPTDRGAFIIASNHQSHLDASAVFIAAYLGGVKKMFAMGARDYFFQNPLKRWFVTNFMNVLPISRKGFTQKDVELLYQVLELSSVEYPIAILMFPEGTRSTSGNMSRFKTGVGYLASRLGIPVVPAYLKGTRESLPKSRSVPLRKKVHLRFGEALEPPKKEDDFEERSMSNVRKERLNKFAQELYGCVSELREDVLAEIEEVKQQKLEARLQQKELRQKRKEERRRRRNRRIQKRYEGEDRRPVSQFFASVLTGLTIFFTWLLDFWQWLQVHTVIGLLWPLRKSRRSVRTQNV